MERTAVERALEVAGAYVRGYFRQFPEDASGSGYPGAPADRLGDLGEEALSAWEAREDAWLAELRSLHAAALAGTAAEVPYGVVLERLEASVERRRCRPELWNVSAAWGWSHVLPVVFTRQPVGTREARADALARAADVPRYLDTEVENLGEGLRLGFAATRENVEAVRAQAEALLSAPPERSPFFDPASRDGDPAFAAELSRVVAGPVRDALRRYRDFLDNEYRPRSDGAAGVGALPCGVEGYRASVRFHASVSPTPEEIHATGLREMERVQREMKEIALRTFGTADVRGLLERVREDPRYTFRSAEGVLAHTRSAVDRARAALPGWFGRVPRAEVVVRPFPAFQRRTGGGLYCSAAEDGSYPATYELGTHAPETLARAPVEATAFHETWPGHHLQISLAMEDRRLHPVVRYLFSSGFIEGWALYAERLADEMGLYSSDLDRLGMLSNEAFRAARLVVDPGLHALGWSRERAIRYLLDHTAESEAGVTYEVDRYVAGPGQATAYLLGRLEIGRLRALAGARLGRSFDLRSFHDRLLEDGSVTLPMVREKIERWIGAAEAAAGTDADAARNGTGP